MSNLSKSTSISKVADESYILREAMKQFYLDNMLNNSKTDSINCKNCNTKELQNIKKSITDFISEKYTGELLSFIYNTDSSENTIN